VPARSERADPALVRRTGIRAGCALARDAGPGRARRRAYPDERLRTDRRLQLIRLVTGPSWRPTEIHFEGAPPEHAERLAALAERSVDFNSPQTIVRFPRRLLAFPLPETVPAPRVASGGVHPSLDPLTSLRQAIEALLRMGSVDVQGDRGRRGAWLFGFGELHTRLPTLDRTLAARVPTGHRTAVEVRARSPQRETSASRWSALVSSRHAQRSSSSRTCASAIPEAIPRQAAAPCRSAFA